MTDRTLIEKAREYFAHSGAIRTAGAVAMYCGRRINDTCESVYQMRRQDRGRGYPLGLRIRAARHGFSARLYLLLGLDDAPLDRYARSVVPMRRLNDGHIEPIHDKYTFQLLTAPYVQALPKLYGRLDGGLFRGSPGESPFEGLEDVLEAAGSVVLKPATGMRGDGVYVVHDGDEGAVVNGSKMRPDEFSAFAANLDRYVVTEFVNQHRYAEAIFPDATNTIRLFSIIDPETGAPTVLRAAHRFGSADSAPTDNWSRGGYCAPVDVDTGRIGLLVDVDGCSRMERSRHPETDAPVEGVTVPYWEDVCDLVCTAAEVHRDAPFVGWDVLVAPDGPVLVEGNARPNVDLLQLERGLFEDPRASRLFDASAEG